MVAVSKSSQKVSNENNKSKATVVKPVAATPAAADKPAYLKTAKEAIHQLIEFANKQDSNNLIEDSSKIFINFTTHKVPTLSFPLHHISLPHAMGSSSGQRLCILIKGKKDEVEEFEGKLKEQGISATVYNRDSFEKDYATREHLNLLKSKFDHFFLDTRIYSKAKEMFGKNFMESGKAPKKLNVAGVADEKLIAAVKDSTKLSLFRAPKNQQFTLEFGNTENTETQLTQNLIAIVSHVIKYFPNSLADFEAISIQLSKSPYLPIYTNYTIPSTVSVGSNGVVLSTITFKQDKIAKEKNEQYKKSKEQEQSKKRKLEEDDWKALEEEFASSDEEDDEEQTEKSTKKVKVTTVTEDKKEVTSAVPAVKNTPKNSNKMNVDSVEKTVVTETPKKATTTTTTKAPEKKVAETPKKSEEVTKEKVEETPKKSAAASKKASDKKDETPKKAVPKKKEDTPKKSQDKKPVEKKEESKPVTPKKLAEEKKPVEKKEESKPVTPKKVVEEKKPVEKKEQSKPVATEKKTVEKQVETPKKTVEKQETPKKSQDKKPVEKKEESKPTEKKTVEKATKKVEDKKPVEKKEESKPTEKKTVEKAVTPKKSEDKKSVEKKEDVKPVATDKKAAVSKKSEE
ncbi:hypothetical protein DLAC_10421 [Tieghemostelium lacteum]|uniref:Ribosomal protein L1 n=1 Tax=Tieghemostelium lacteum TaxID=361077 RepID=A0A151Z5D7_TIELA|nr:hypothetical protein DLAC_10421 [Tieghemostelium lacteum]|eukprot:KYQ89176.1 hypothetical protein DLAC_10421 [Tieghemostelium lacteum]